jgi:uncharacterized membrane protein YfcA
VLQTLFLFNAILVVTAHFLSQHVTGEVITFYLYSLPALVAGILVGSRLDRKVSRDRFRTIVTILILLLGLALLLGTGGGDGERIRLR